MSETNVFDASAPFFMGLQLPDGPGGLKRSIKHLFKPLTDDDIAEFDRRQTGKTVVNKNEVERESGAAAAAVWLYGKAVTGLERSWTDAELPADWKEKVGDKQRLDVISLIFQADIESAEGDVDEIGNETGAWAVEFKANGEKFKTLHYIKPVTAAQLDHYEHLQSREELIRGNRGGRGAIRRVSAAKSIGELYDRMIERVEGYASGRVPLHHKMLVVRACMSAAATDAEGNGSDSNPQ